MASLGTQYEDVQQELGIARIVLRSFEYEMDLRGCFTELVI